jgi:hypothetical protein
MKFGIITYNVMLVKKLCYILNRKYLNKINYIEVEEYKDKDNNKYYKIIVDSDKVDVKTLKKYHDYINTSNLNLIYTDIMLVLKRDES